MTKKQAIAIIYNLALLAAVYLGAWEGVTFIGYLLIAFIWYMAAQYFYSLYIETAIEPLPRYMPFLVSFTLDAVIIYMLVGATWYVTASVYGISALTLELIIIKHSKIHLIPTE